MVKIIAGHWKGRRVRTVEGEGYRPAMGRVREALFSMLESRGVRWENARVLDVFAGSGSLGWEALSRGAGMVWFVENDPRAVRLLRDQVAGFALPGMNVRVLVGDAVAVLSKKAPLAFDLLFFDPPYGRGLLVPAMVRANAHGWAAPEALACAEVEAGWDWAAMDLSGYELLVNRLYGQTRIVVWKKIPQKNASPSTPAPSTP